MKDTHSGRINVGKDAYLLLTLFYIAVSIFAIICLFPFLLMISSSFMTEQEILSEGFKLIPRKITLSAYEFLFGTPKKLLTAYGVTIFITIMGTSLGLFFMSMAGYVLNRKDFKYRNFFSFFIYFTTLFSGGLIPSYMVNVNLLNLKDSIWVMILPVVISAWSIFLMRNFMKSIPDSLYESATIDGAGDFQIYLRVFMPLAIPSLATIGLFAGLGYWNQWYQAMLYIQSADKYPLQYFLHRVVNQANVQVLLNTGVVMDLSEVPTQSIKMATAVIATGPIILLFPFLQKYFITGLTVGSVKG